MNKDAYYFSHDSNARNDQRLLKVRMQHGMQGYGIYFGIVEILREQEGYILSLKDIPSIAYDLRIEIPIIEEIIFNYDLFVMEDDIFYSKSLKKRLELMDEMKLKRVEAGRKGGIASAKVKQESSNAKALNKTKENKTKIKDINERYNKFKDQSQEFISIYGKDLIHEFISYWTEPNKSNTKMKFELQQTFDIKRRLSTWDKNSFGSLKRKDNSLDAQLVERSKNSKKEDTKFKEYIKKADAEAVDEIPNLNEWRVTD